MSRFFVDNSYYFITVPTIKHISFFNTPNKKSLILEKLDKSIKRFKLNDFDFGIISDHYHFVSYFNYANIIPKLLQLINGGSAYSLNRITGNKKQIWDEYFIYLIEDEILLDKVRGYVVGNPLKHKEVRTLEELERYPFSSYKSLIKKLGKDVAKELILSVIPLEEEEFIKKYIKRVKKPNLTKVSVKKTP